MAHLSTLALAWIGYFVLHSGFATLRVKRWVAMSRPGAMPYYRLVFNAASLLLLIPILLLIEADSGPWLWRWHGALGWLALALRVSAILGFIASLRSYDLATFLGWRQRRASQRVASDAEALRISEWHRYVRHPWYFLLLILVWSGDMNWSLLMSAVLMTTYLVVGAALEERKLVVCYGPAYGDYMRRVGGLIPRPWKILSRRHAVELEAQASAFASGPTAGAAAINAT